MNKTFISITFIILIVNTTISFNCLLAGIAQHDSWRIILSSIALTLMIIAGAITSIYYLKQKAKQAM